MPSCCRCANVPPAVPPADACCCRVVLVAAAAAIHRSTHYSGFTHTAFTFSYESLITKSPVLEHEIPPGALITFLQKGLAYTGIEEHLNEDGTERQCDEKLSLVTAHVCHSNSAPAPVARNKVKSPSKSALGGENTADDKGDANAPQGMDVDDERGKEKKEVSTADTDISDDAVALLTNHSSEVFMCAWNPKYDLLASGSGDATARIWSIPPESRGKTVGGPAKQSSIVLKHSAEIGDKNKDVTTLEWNRDGSMLATGSYDGLARVWGRGGVLKHKLQAHEGPIFSLKWNAAGNYLLSGSSDWSAIVWDVAAGRVQQRFQFHNAATLDVDWKDNTTFASCSTDKAINILQVGLATPQQTFTGHTDEVNAIKWDPTGNLLASCSDDYTAKIWKPSSSSCVHDLREHKKEIYTIKWGPNPQRQQLLASASFDATVKLWDVEVGSVLATLSRHQDPVYSVAFSPSGEFLASGSFAGHLYIWNVKNGELIKSYQGNGDIFEVAWNHREDRIAACFSTSTVAIIDLKV
jgi:transducin (beta)-like 1